MYSKMDHHTSLPINFIVPQAFAIELPVALINENENSNHYISEIISPSKNI